MNAPPDARAAAPIQSKAAVREQWNRCAQGWNEHTPSIRRWLAPATAAMLDMAGVRPGTHVLDVAAGAGDQTLDIARRVGTGGRVLATDLSPVILQFAKANAEREGLSQVETQVCDGEQLPVGSGSFDAVVCRLGLMLFADPLQGLREMHRALRPGGGVCTLVFSAPEANPCIGILMRTALRHAGLPPLHPSQPGGLLSLGKRGLLDELFRAAGFHEVATTTLDAPFRLPSVKHYIEFVRASASPIQQIIGRLGADAAQAAWDDIESQLSTFSTADGWVGPNELLLTAARK